MIPLKAPTRRAALLELMVRNKWSPELKVSCSEWFNQRILAAHGGTRFQARLFEIVREDTTLAYDCRCINEATGEFVYRLRARRDGEPRPVSRRSKVKELEAQVASLTTELAKYRNRWLAEAGL